MLKGEHKASEFQSLNPFGQVPVLVDKLLFHVYPSGDF
ncbi:hypothetical protein [Nostoc sp. CHAB 5715]|nr:hypothetical protein [Nostoc sp. CHAB 5715]